MVYEVNARCWLRALSERLGEPVRLGNVPEAEFDGWQGRGFTHVWLMGTWAVGPRSRAASWNDADLRRRCAEALPGMEQADLAGSPYAVSAYKTPRELGGESGLKKFRQQLSRRGLRLLLDFVPNHLGLDHEWVAEHPERFVQRGAPGPGIFRPESAAGELWLAHGKDPNFPAWTDTVQLDYRRPATRAAMIEVLKDIARRCDGVRCDMAMLLLNDVFVKTWQDFPPIEPPPATEFWEKAIGSVRAGQPEFMFLAEAYWDTEARLQALGFDYVYDKRLCDCLAARDHAAAQRHLLSCTPELVRAGAHFLENHDEARIASVLAAAEQRAAALVILGLPGMRLLHDGQLTGARVRAPVQLGRRAAETPQAEVEALYDELLGALAKSAVGRGEGKVLPLRAAWPDNCTCANFVVVQWQAGPPTFDLVVVNLAPHRSQCYTPLEAPDLAKYNWRMQDMLGQERYERCGDDLQNQGLYLDVAAHGAQLFHFEPL